MNDPELPEWIRSYNNLINPLLSWHNPNIDPEETHRNLVVTFGQQIFTPSDIDRTTVDPDDRPYAGWLYLGLGYNQNNDRWMDSTQLNIGVIGPAALGQEAQDFIHDLRGFENSKAGITSWIMNPAFSLCMKPNTGRTTTRQLKA